MKKYLTVVSLIVGGVAVAGGSSTGTPPALQDSMEMLMSNPTLDGGLYKGELGNIGIITRKPMAAEAVVTKTPLLRTQALRFSETDFDFLSLHKEPIEAVNELGGNLSMEVLPSESEETVILKDRRLIMRESLKAQ